MGLPKGMQHVSREDLYTSLPSRIQYLQSFLEFTSDDVNALIEGQKYIKAVIPAIVNIVYKKLLKYDITARAFTTRDTRNEESIEEYATEDSAQIQHRKMFLRWYLTKLNSDPTKMEYWEYLDKVGLMHVGLGRRNPLHIDYIFLGSCLGFIQDSMFEAILCHPHLHMSKKIALIKALGKVIWIQNDLFAKWHCTDGKEYEDDEELNMDNESEKEGYIHGKKILGTTGSDSDAASVANSVSSADSKASSIGRIREDVEARQKQQSSAAASRCPFSGMPSPSVAGQRAATVTTDRTRAPDGNTTPRASAASAASQHSRSNSEDEPLGSARQQQALPQSPSSSSSYSPRRESMIPRLHVQNGKIVGKEQLAQNGNIFE